MGRAGLAISSRPVRRALDRRGIARCRPAHASRHRAHAAGAASRRLALAERFEPRRGRPAERVAAPRSAPRPWPAKERRRSRQHRRAQACAWASSLWCLAQAWLAWTAFSEAQATASTRIRGHHLTPFSHDLTAKYRAFRIYGFVSRMSLGGRNQGLPQPRVTPRSMDRRLKLARHA